MCNKYVEKWFWDGFADLILYGESSFSYHTNGEVRGQVNVPFYKWNLDFSSIDTKHRPLAAHLSVLSTRHWYIDRFNEFYLTWQYEHSHIASR